MLENAGKDFAVNAKGCGKSLSPSLDAHSVLASIGC